MKKGQKIVEKKVIATEISPFKSLSLRQVYNIGVSTL
jgi:hypothetical protein